MAEPPVRASSRIRSARANRRPPSFAATLVALAIVFALAWAFFVRSGPSASAPQVEGIRGEYTWTSAGGAVLERGAFSAVAGGDAGGGSIPGDVSPESGPSSTAYDATARVESRVSRDGAAAVGVRTVGAWPPVWRLATADPLDYQGLAAVVRAAVEDGDRAVGVKPLKQGERAVWRAAMTIDGREIDLVVDQETGITTWCSDGGRTFTAVVDWASPPPAGQTYSVTPPAGTAMDTVRDGTVYFPSPAAAGRTAGYAPLVSDLAPDGFTVRAVAAWPADHRPAQWLDDDAASDTAAGPAELLVAQLYTRGLSWFAMEQLGPGASRTLGGSFVESTEAAARAKLSFQQTTLQYGAFKGRTASTWYQESGPSLFVAGPHRAVFVTGALTRRELVAFAEGLEPVTAPE